MAGVAGLAYEYIFGGVLGGRSDVSIRLRQCVSRFVVLSASVHIYHLKLVRNVPGAQVFVVFGVY